MGRTDASASRWPAARSKVYSPRLLGEPGARAARRARSLGGSAIPTPCQRGLSFACRVGIASLEHVHVGAEHRGVGAGARVDREGSHSPIRAVHGCHPQCILDAPMHYDGLGLSLTYGPSKRRVRVEADLGCVRTVRVGGPKSSKCHPEWRLRPWSPTDLPASGPSSVPACGRPSRDHSRQ